MRPSQGRGRLRPMKPMPIALLLAVAALPAAHAQADADAQALQARGRDALRAMDCARCHGKHYDGWAAPSLLAAVREGSRERFERYVLDGSERGMPGYRSQPLVVAELDAIYAYLRAQAEARAAGR